MRRGHAPRARARHTAGRCVSPRPRCCRSLARSARPAVIQPSGACAGVPARTGMTAAHQALRVRSLRGASSRAQLCGAGARCRIWPPASLRGGRARCCGVVAFAARRRGLSARWATARSWCSAIAGCDRGWERSVGARRAAAAPHIRPAAVTGFATPPRTIWRPIGEPRRCPRDDRGRRGAGPVLGSPARRARIDVPPPWLQISGKDGATVLRRRLRADVRAARRQRRSLCDAAARG